MVGVSHVYTSTGCNTSSHCLCVSRSSDTFVFASDAEIVSGTVVNCREDLSRILQVSPREHASKITCIKRLKGDISNDFFLSGGSDGRVVVWSLSPDGSCHALFKTDMPENSSVGTVAGFILGSHMLIVAAWVGEGQGVQVITLKHESSQINEVQSQSLEGLGNAFALSADMQMIEGALILAIGTSKRTIEIYHLQKEQKFEKSLSLPAHSDWIHAVSFNESLSGPTLLASAGQDTYVKLWQFKKQDEESDSDEISVTKNSFSVPVRDSSIKLDVLVEAVLAGHEDWVHSVAWDATGSRLVTSSSDKSVIVWSETEQGGVWTDSVRLGIVGGQAAGFYSAEFSTDATRIVASSYYGGLYGWIVSGDDEYLWEPLSMPSGHSTEVRDVAWEPRGGNYLISVGKDQTTRVFAPVMNQNTWAEIGRPQVHGHDMQCVVAVDAGRFVSGAEEKIFRAFGAPQIFANSLCAISGCDKEKVFSGCSLSEFGARVPALGLSNKAVDEDEQIIENDNQHWEEAAFHATPTNLEAPPTEDCLMQNTLWPELHKLYGHGFEVYALAANPNGTIIATACKASHVDHAQILFWSTVDWSRQGQASGHQLTVTQLEWSPDGQKLVSVSRDRTAIIYLEKNNDVNGFDWDPIWKSGKEHSRIVWSCAWASDSQHFSTGSRDQKIVLWRWDSSSNTAYPLSSYKSPLPITAVAISKSKDIQSAVIVIGLQDGSLQLLQLDGSELKTRLNVNNQRIKGVDAGVLRLRFQPLCDEDPTAQLLAVAGTDCKMRIYKILR